jgi:hypothetical protein
MSSSHQDVRHLAEHIAGNFGRSGANHGDIGSEISQRLAKHPTHVADAFRRRYGITEADSHEEMGRKFHERHRGGWSKDPELAKPKQPKAQHLRSGGGVGEALRLASSLLGGRRRGGSGFKLPKLPRR